MLEILLFSALELDVFAQLEMLESYLSGLELDALTLN